MTSTRHQDELAGHALPRQLDGPQHRVRLSEYPTEDSWVQVVAGIPPLREHLPLNQGILDTGRQRDRHIGEAPGYLLQGDGPPTIVTTFETRGARNFLPLSGTES